ncbi:MarR family winged helix-turn-helix transcriptional regulator [Bailinhaonella thermotolerans]|uniref:MarR family transcriptional regulator n=1 Tax=Bailinhaonella thermotolerans TaxID=1070861 RepID=A0A3A4A9V1_9ACTN|nr:MarR family transcriptional regulator [Bailinhaonella thermotolerans]RJL24819.1 MarR family transcriptional regulator [Bailinhaonella thermotolerans]
MDDTDLGWELSTAVVLFHEAVARRLGLSAVDHKALGVITRRGPLTAGALAAELGMNASAVTALVDRLERAGHARRAPDPADRRRVLVHPAGTPALGDVFAALTREMTAMMSKYDERETAAILDYIRNTIAVLRAQTAALTAAGERPRP